MVQSIADKSTFEQEIASRKSDAVRKRRGCVFFANQSPDRSRRFGFIFDHKDVNVELRVRVTAYIHQSKPKQILWWKRLEREYWWELKNGWMSFNDFHEEFGHIGLWDMGKDLDCPKGIHELLKNMTLGQMIFDE